MTTHVRNVVILGSTGSVGRSTLEVISQSQGRLRAFGLTAHKRLGALEQQAAQAEPAWVVATDCGLAEDYAWSQLPPQTQLLIGSEGIETLVAHPEVDVVVAAIVGSAGLRGTWAALQAGKTVALANKEALVMAGPLVMQLAREQQATILPIDSEHSAVFQLLEKSGRKGLERIILTASGGAFRDYTTEQLQQVSVDDALTHPTWDMGPKITVDSATMMNKALEIIEARWLFDVPVEKIEVVIHRQSIVHSLVEFTDGSTLAQMSPPDMKLPIQYALSHPDRWPSATEKMDFSRAFQLDFQPPDPQRFPALELGREVARQGGTAGAVLNGANEAAVAEFLAGRLEFNNIVPACRAVLEHHEFDASPTLEQLEFIDAWARKEITRWNSV
ncbi:MAG: 1-deoxy-D-xylulose-5-phosphate reductoisomerase [Pirellulaceae bacterium]